MKRATVKPQRQPRYQPRCMSREAHALVSALRRRCWRAALARRARGLRREPIVATDRHRRQQFKPARVASGLRQYAALQCVAENCAIVDNALALAGAVNMARTLADFGLGAEHAPLIHAAERAIDRLNDCITTGAKANLSDAIRPPAGRQSLLEAAELVAIEAMLGVHRAQLDHPDCTRRLLAMAEADVRRRAGGARAQRDPRMSRPGDVSEVGRLIKCALDDVRRLAAPAPGSDLDEAFTSLHVYVAVAMEVFSHTPAQVLHDSAARVLALCSRATVAEGAVA